MSMTSPPSAPPPPTPPPTTNAGGLGPGAGAPSGPPPPGPPPPRPGSQTSQRSILLVVGGAAIIGLIVAGGSLFAQVNRQGTSFKYGWPFVLIGATVGLLVGAVILLAARQAGLRPSRLELITVLAVCAVVGALLGLAFAPPKVEPEDVSPITEQEQQQRRQEYGDLPEGSRAGPIDRDGDGQADLDENGDPIIGIDTDGDGEVDSYLVPCPEGSPEPRWPNGERPIEVSYQRDVRFAPASLLGPGLAQSTPPEDGQRIDAECDGTIDAVIPYDDEFLVPPGGDFDAAPGPAAPPSTISPQERESKADQRSSASSGQILRFLGIALAVALLVGLVAWLVLRWRGRTSPDEPDEQPAVTLPPPASANPNFERSIEDMIEDPDPRNGILAAYGRLLIGFDEIGLGRMTHEGPQEHLDRALAECSADPVAAKELASWFSLARFSNHPITEEDRRQAVDALRRVTSTMRPGATAAVHAPGAPSVPAPTP